MSGYEIAGVILGVIPTITGALKESMSTWKGIKGLWKTTTRAKEHIDNLIETLELNHALVETNMSVISQGLDRNQVCLKTV